MAQMTKRTLEASLKNLLHQKPLNQITISDITENCGISRMTFYYHFKDIYWVSLCSVNWHTGLQRAISEVKSYLCFLSTNF